MTEPFEAMASRTLLVDGKPGFTFRIGRPFLAPEGDCWFCPYEIEGPLTSRRSRCGGHDAMQALVGALYVLDAEIETSAEHELGRLSFFADGTDFGLPSLPRA